MTVVKMLYIKKFALKFDLFSNVMCNMEKIPLKRKIKKVIYIDLGLISKME